MQFSLTRFSQHVLDISLNFGEYFNTSLTTVKFPNIFPVFQTSRQVVILSLMSSSPSLSLSQSSSHYSDCCCWKYTVKYTMYNMTSLLHWAKTINQWMNYCSDVKNQHSLSCIVWNFTSYWSMFLDKISTTNLITDLDFVQADLFTVHLPQSIHYAGDVVKLDKRVRERVSLILDLHVLSHNTKQHSCM